MNMTFGDARRGLAQSQAMQDLVKRLPEAIGGGGGVLICGEPGSGRSRLARLIHVATYGNHDSSVEHVLNMDIRNRREARPFVIVECAGTGELEGELFGAKPGTQETAFGGLDRIVEGSAVHRAQGGTLFLSQLPDMPAGLQIRLARMLRDGEVWVEARGGGTPRLERVALRPIATIDSSADDQRIAPELLKRLEQSRIDMPPLRNRREDISALVRQLLLEICAEQRVPLKKISRQAARLLSALPWRGNVRELRALLGALVLKVPGVRIRQADVLENVRLEGGPTTFVYAGTLREARERFERDYVTAVLEQHRGRMAEAAKALGIQRTNLYRKVRQLAVKRRPPGRNTP